MSKQEKQFARLLHKKILSSEEAVRLIELDGWYHDPNDISGGSHRQFIHKTKKGKVTIPLGRKTLPHDTQQDILIQAGLI